MVQCAEVTTMAEPGLTAFLSLTIELLMRTHVSQKSPDRMRLDFFGKLEVTDAWGRLAELFFRKSKFCDIYTFTWKHLE